MNKSEIRVDFVRAGGWRDIKSVQRYMGLLNDSGLETVVEAAWA